MKNIVKFVIPLILVIAIPIVLFLQNKESDIQKIDRICKRAYEEFQPTGLSVCILKDDQIIYEKAMGYRNAHNMDIMDNTNIFNIASCTKAFTAAAIGKLVQEGLLSWDDKVIDFIPDFKLSDEYITQNLRINDILSHRTGLGTFYGDLLWYNTSYSNEEVIQKMQYLPITADFRTEFGYQNNMFTIAGEIVENVTGLDWEDFIQQTFIEPLEMTSTRTSSDQFDGTESIAFPHLNDSTLAIYYFQAGKPAASLWSNTRDLANWTKLFLNEGKWKNDQILKPEIIKELTDAHTIIPVSKSTLSLGIHFQNYAFGWKVFDYNGLKIITHNGGMPGYISDIAIIPELDASIIILNNGFNLYCNDAILFSTIDILTENTNDWIKFYLDSQAEYDNYIDKINSDRIAQREQETKPSFNLEKIDGEYTDQMYGNAIITIENNEAVLSLEPAKKVFSGKLEHWDNDNYKVQFKDPFLPYGIIRFYKDSKGDLEGFKIDLPSHDFHFELLDFKKVN